MAKPSPKEPLSNVIRYARYSIARVRADPEVAPLAEVVTGPFANLKQAVHSRNDADDAVLDHQAKRDFHLHQVQAAIRTLGVKALGHFESRTAEGYLRLFPKPPSQLLDTPERDRKEVLGKLVSTALAEETPAELSTSVSVLANAWQKLQESQDALDQKLKAHAAAKKLEDELRESLAVSLTRLQAQLTDRFPQDRARVQAYFPITRPKRRKDEEPGEPSSLSIEPGA